MTGKGGREIRKERLKGESKGGKLGMGRGNGSRLRKENERGDLDGRRLRSSQFPVRADVQGRTDGQISRDGEMRMI
jgi:hypothetical protein